MAAIESTKVVPRSTEAALDFMEAEKEFHRNLLRAETAIKEGARKRLQQIVPADLRGCRGRSCDQGRQPCRERCGAEMGGDEPAVATVPTRSYPKHPRLNVWRRMVLAWTRLCAGFRRT